MGADCRLSAVDFGHSTAPPMVLLHGMRDHALSMQSIALGFPEYHVIAMDLRGHGDSDNPGSYTMAQLVADLGALLEHFDLTRPILIGHSLGGHIVVEYAAFFPASVEKLVIIDGLGPPRLPEDAADQSDQGRSVPAPVVPLSGARRVMRDKGDALTRLRRNNPKLKAEAARFIVEHGIEAHPEGGVCWKWDPRVNRVWGTFSHDESEVHYSWIECPVQLISGENSLDYWVQNRPQLSGQQQLHDSELERRRQLFKDAGHTVIEGAGHMIHYDEPDALNDAIRVFLDSSSN